MDGLDCQELLYSETKINKDFRIDSQFFTSQIKHNKSLSYAPIGNFLLSTQYGVSKDMNTENIGFPIFRMNEIHHSLCDLMPEKSVELSSQEFSDLKLQNRDVLFNRTNSYELVGRTGIYYDTGIPQTFASYLVRLVPDNTNLYSEYLTAFLNTRYGIQEIRRRARQSVNQTNVNPEEVKAIEIPLLSPEFQEKIKWCYQVAHQLRIRSQEMYHCAESLLNDRFQLNNTSETVSINLFSESLACSGRLDAEYYQPKYKIYSEMLHTTDTVESLCTLHDKTFLPVPDKTYRYIELSNVGNFGDISDIGTLEGSELPSRARRKVKSGQIIVSSIEGSLQSCALITDELNNCLCSTGFYVLDSQSINPETLLILFKSNVIQALMKQRCSGTILTAISKDEFLSLPLPKIGLDLQEKIATQVKASFDLHHQSVELLGYAISAIELAIDQNEVTAFTWLKEKIASFSKQEM